jgi:hypothetical protein
VLFSPGHPLALITYVVGRLFVLQFVPSVREQAGKLLCRVLTKIDDLRSTRSPESGSQLRSGPVHPEQRSLVVLKRVRLLSHRQLSSVNGQVGRGD